MKRLLSLVLCACLLVFCAACAPDTGSSSEPAEPTTETPTAAPLPEDARVLVAYFSWADNAILDDNVDAVSSPSVLPPGNVQQLAEWVQQETAGDLFAIRVTEPYPSDWDACLDRAHDERGEDARPALVESVANIDDYDVIFLGYPNWWYGVPMPLLTFLEENDLSGKQVYLFCSHGTGGLAESVNIITEALPEAQISDNIFHCYEEEASSSESAIKNWVRELGFTQSASVASEEQRIYLQIGDTQLVATLENNSSAEALVQMLQSGPVTIDMEDYANMEKVGPLGQELPRNDEQISTTAGDIILYQGNQLVIYYDENNWNFTRLGRINDTNAEMLRNILGEGNVSVTLSLV